MTIIIATVAALALTGIIIAIVTETRFKKKRMNYYEETGLDPEVGEKNLRESRMRLYKEHMAETKKRKRKRL